LPGDWIEYSERFSRAPGEQAHQESSIRCLASSRFHQGLRESKAGCPQSIRPEACISNLLVGYYYLTPSHSPKNPWKKNIPDHSLSALAERHLGVILDGESETERRAAQESAVLLPLHDIMDALLAKNGLHRIADLEFRAVCSLAEMEISGIYLDCDQAKRIVEEEENEICNIIWTVHDEARRKGFVTVSQDGKKLSYYLNPDRQEDVLAFLKSRGYGVINTKAEVLRGLAAAGCAFAEAVLRYRHVSHLLAFLNNWLSHVHAKDGRIHPHYYFEYPAALLRGCT
jgi:DNA polymerase I-like protein with 3'-5' exonuclease and polymerase domains